MFFGKTEEQWQAAQGVWTAKEILQQPNTWRKTVAQMREIKDTLASFIEQVTCGGEYNIILSGAGTSEYVGNVAARGLAAKYGFHIRAYGSTDIVVAPRKYISSEIPTLMVHFARSGESKESIGAIQAAQKVCGRVYHLVITCNENGTLARTAEGMDNCFLIKLAPETQDKSMAMTSSFSNMLLSVLLCLQLDAFEEIAADVERMCRAAEKVLANYKPALELVDRFDFDRIVYLGSCDLKEIAHEAMLKILELTWGKVVPIFDTPTGFRHGPSTFITPKTLIVIFLSDDPLERLYEKDMLNDLRIRKDGNVIVAVGNRHDAEIAQWADMYVSYEAGKDMPDSLLGLGYITFGQMIALFKSQKLGFTTDDPQRPEAAKRMVPGMILYPAE